MKLRMTGIFLLFLIGLVLDDVTGIGVIDDPVAVALFAIGAVSCGCNLMCFVSCKA